MSRGAPRGLPGKPPGWMPSAEAIKRFIRQWAGHDGALRTSEIEKQCAAIDVLVAAGIHFEDRVVAAEEKLSGLRDELVARRECLVACRDDLERITTAAVEDGGIWIRAVASGRLAYVDQAIASTDAALVATAAAGLVDQRSGQA